MKKKLLILCTFLAIASISISAEKDAVTGGNNSSTETSSTSIGGSQDAAPVATGASAKGDSFMTAFGMGGSSTSDTGEAGPSGGGGSSGAGSMSSALSVGAASAGNQVSPPFTPYSYRK